MLGVVYYRRIQPDRLPALSADKLGSVGERLGAVGASVGDRLRATKLEGAVKAALELNRQVNTHRIAVDAQDDGTVVLEGSVPSEEARATAARVAAGVPDVSRVENRLRVDASLAPPSSSERSLGENLDDRTVEAKVRLAYSLNKDMEGAEVKVSAFRREVTLAGTVGSEAQRELAVRIAEETPQVASVKDSLQVAGAPAPSAPASPVAGALAPAVAADRVRAAQAALAANANLAPFRLQVRAEGGRLVLTGRVRTGAERDLAGIVAKQAASAAVENNVVVQP